MQHSTTLHPASEWPVLLLILTSFLSEVTITDSWSVSWGLAPSFLFVQPFFGGWGWCYGILFLDQNDHLTFLEVFFPLTKLLGLQQLNPFMEIKDIIASQEFVNLRDSESFFHLWRWYLMILSSCGKCFLSSLSKELRMEKSQALPPKPHRRGLRSLVLPLPPPSSPQSSTTTGRLVLTAQPSNPSNRRSRRANNSGTDLPPLEPSFSTRFT